ncbi:hypothetical protein GCM10022251_03920 [Phytohabitans flavus]
MVAAIVVVVPPSTPPTACPTRPRPTYRPPHSAKPSVAPRRNRRYDIRSPPAASGTRVFKTGRNGATMTIRGPSRRNARSAAAHRDSPIQRPIRPPRTRSPRWRPTTKLSDHPTRLPRMIERNTMPPPSGPRAPSAVSTTTSLGTRMPTRGIASSTMITLSAAANTAAGSSATHPSQSVMQQTLWAYLYLDIRAVARSHPPDPP